MTTVEVVALQSEPTHRVDRRRSERLQRRNRRRSEGARERLARRLGVTSATQEVIERWLAEAQPRGGGASALDAGCGRQSLLRGVQPRPSRFVGVDIHRPAKRPRWLDDFVEADLCRDADAFSEASFDVVLSNFTLEHFREPDAAIRNIGGWLKPGGWLVLATVNRRHPFVDLYLGLPTRLRDRLQPLVKRSDADAHALVGACNTPRRVHAALTAAGFTQIDIVTTSHLGRAWGRTLPTWALGSLGDLATARVPARRSTIVARARRPGP